jgi:hypothetical protein
MAFDRDKLYQQAETAIKENNLFFIEDIIAFIPCSKQTFYDYFPVGSDEMDDLKGLLEKNKIRTKSAIRAKLYKSPKASELLALYRLICTPEERKMLNQNYIELTGKDGKDLLPKIEIEIVNGEG